MYLKFYAVIKINNHHNKTPIYVYFRVITYKLIKAFCPLHKIDTNGRTHS